jgi:WD40 repeat protein
VAFSPDGLTLASGSEDRTIKLWDTATGTQRRTLEGHENWASSIAFSPDGLTLSSGPEENTIKLWDTATGTQLEGHSHLVNSGAFSPDGLTPALEKGLDDCQISLSNNWVSLGGENVLWLPAEYRSFECQAVNGATLALGYADGRVLVTEFLKHII